MVWSALEPVKPAPFEYVAPTTLDEALQALTTPGARVIAGGQSLLQDLRWRRVSASVLVDVAGLEDWPGCTEAETVRIGARVRHVDLEPGAVGGRSGPARRHRGLDRPPAGAQPRDDGRQPLLRPPRLGVVRPRGRAGRLGGAGVGPGRRPVGVADFLRGPHETAIDPAELATAVLLPRLPEGTRTSVVESRRTHASYAHVAVTAALLPDGSARLGWPGRPDRPSAHAAEAALARGEDPGAAAAGTTPTRGTIRTPPSPTPATSPACSCAGSSQTSPRECRMTAIEVDLHVNGTTHRVVVEPRRALADVLRDDLGLTGTHLGCEHGVCGTCTVLVDGEPVRACLCSRCRSVAGRSAPSEGLRRRRHPGSAADGVLGAPRAAVRVLHARVPHAAARGARRGPGVVDDDDRLDALLASNLCRCTGYEGIRKAARAVRCRP